MPVKYGFQIYIESMGEMGNMNHKEVIGGKKQVSH